MMPKTDEEWNAAMSSVARWIYISFLRDEMHTDDPIPKVLQSFILDEMLTDSVGWKDCEDTPEASRATALDYLEENWTWI